MRYLFGEPAVPKDAGICMNNLLTDIDKFDASEFSLLAKEAQLMDPGQRELLLTAWQAIDDAGYSPQQWMNTNTGIFVGGSTIMASLILTVMFKIRVCTAVWAR